MQKACSCPSVPVVRLKIGVLLTLAIAGLWSLTSCVGLVAGAGVAPTIQMTATPATIFPGQTVTLSWTSTNATTATLSGVGQVAAVGTMNVTPTQTTTYNITANALGGQTANATATVTVVIAKISISANPTTITAGQPTVLTVTASNVNQVAVTDNIDSNSYPVSASGGTVTVYPLKNATYTATGTPASGPKVTANVSITVNPGSINTSINHVIFEMQENRSFDSYFGMLNPYRVANGFNVSEDGNTYTVDGIDDKLTKISNVDDEGQSFSLFKLKSTCIDDDSSAWLQSYGDVNRYDFLITRPILMDGFVHTAEGFAKCGKNCGGGGDFTDLVGQRAMGYYDQTYLNYYYYMASQFAISDRWFSPVSAESTPNRIATMTGGTTQGLVHDPGNEDHLGVQLGIETIFQELDGANVSWKIYYSTTEDQCLVGNHGTCGNGQPINKFPATTFTAFTYSTKYLYANPTKAPCQPPTVASGQAVGDPNNNFCIDITHVAPVTQFFADLKGTTLPSFSWIDPGYSNNDEHPGSGQSILLGQAQVANMINAFIASTYYYNSVFFWSYDEGGGPYDHVPPVPGHTNDNTDPSLGITTDISSIAVNPDSYNPCVPGNPNDQATLHCDLWTAPPKAFNDPGVNPNDAPALQGFAAQLGFRLPNMIISPYIREHYVSHTPIDHTAVIRFVEGRFIGTGTHLTARDGAQPDLSEFFDFTNVPWMVPPTPPAPYPTAQAGPTCTPQNMGP